MTRLETPRLILDELTEEDAEFTLALLNDPAFIANVGDRGVRDVEQAKHYLRDGPIASYRDNGFGMYAVRSKANAATLGMCGLVRRATLVDVDIGYALLPEARGHGYALEAAQRVMRFAIEEIGLTRLVAIVAPDNQSSIDVLLRLGMVYEDVIRLAPDDELIRLYSWDAIRCRDDARR